MSIPLESIELSGFSLDNTMYIILQMQQDIPVHSYV